MWLASSRANSGHADAACRNLGRRRRGSSAGPLDSHGHGQLGGVALPAACAQRYGDTVGEDGCGADCLTLVAVQRGALSCPTGRLPCLNAHAGSPASAGQQSAWPHWWMLGSTQLMSSAAGCPGCTGSGHHEQGNVCWAGRGRSYRQWGFASGAPRTMLPFPAGLCLIACPAYSANGLPDFLPKEINRGPIRVFSCRDESCRP